MVHNMNTRPAVRADLTNAQATIQTFLLIVVSFITVWLSVYRVPWQVSGDPCLLAAAAAVVIVTCFWLTLAGTARTELGTENSHIGRTRARTVPLNH